MKHGHTEDKQLKGISLEAVMEKRRLDQALNAKEFAVCAGVSYSTARDWFRLPGFPAFRGVIFWQDFVQWRPAQNGFKHPAQHDASAIACLNFVSSTISHDFIIKKFVLSPRELSAVSPFNRLDKMTNLPITANRLELGLFLTKSQSLLSV